MFPEIEELILEPQQPKTVNSRLDPHQMVFDTRNGNYYITCQGSNELRAYNSNDEFLWTVNIGVYPQELVLDKSRNKIYVTCMEDRVNFSGKIGSVSIVNIQTQSLETHLFSGYQPHGLALNESAGKLLIANRNISQEGPAPHHTTQCAGRNGYITIIDVNQNKVMNGSKLELSVDPYGATFKP
jgi:DNA-binding beta-propeller fold protein YncE